MVDYRQDYQTRSTDPYQEQGRSGYIGPIVALAVIAILIGSIFFLAGGSPGVDPETITGAPAAIETAPATPAQPVEVVPAQPVTIQ
jgi:hypothetical protein